MSDKIHHLIQQTIKQRAESYTPEWRFDAQNPDIGSALALVYANMMMGSKKRFSQAMLKNRIAFLNDLGAKLLPAVPSLGYVHFDLVNEEVDGVEVPRKTVVFANVEELPEGRVAFETQDDVYVTPAKITDIYQVSDINDFIANSYERQESQWEPFPMFSLQGENKQEHVMYFSNETLFFVRDEVEILVSPYLRGEIPLQDAYLAALLSPSIAVFEYYSENGWKNFSKVEGVSQGILLKKAQNQPAFEKLDLEGYENYWIRCRVLQFEEVNQLRLERLRLSSCGRIMPPEIIYGNGEECDRYRCLPFGEKLELYQEVYFGSEEVLSKKGANITFSFNLFFEKVPLETNHLQEIQWEWIMKRGDIKVNQEFDVSIEEVIWEYYNGYGWKRLFSTHEYDRVFSMEDGVRMQYRKISFVCPEDMEKILVNAKETYYIRARILKINHLYKLNGYYQIPHLENVAFFYEYEKDAMQVEQLVFYNNLEYEIYEKNQKQLPQVYQPFWQSGCKKLGVYFGFERAPIGSPLKLFVSIANDQYRNQQALSWEYWNGKEWKLIPMVDETMQLSRTGMLTFSGNSDMEERKLFGKKRFWIRCLDSLNSYFRENERVSKPLISRMDFNTTTIKNVYSRQMEYLQMEMYQKNAVFDLLERNIYSAVLYVDEKGQLSQEELEDLEAQKRVKKEIDEFGQEEHIWVLWDQVEDFLESGPFDRHYVIEQSDGQLLFGDGKQGKIPRTSKMENIVIEYLCGGGIHTNLPEGTITRMEQSIGFINEITNIGDTFGGEDKEDLEEAMQRNSAKIRHQSRAICARDYEELALCASREVRYAKCFMGLDEKGNRLPGAITLVILQRGYLQGQKHFHLLQDKVLKYMQQRVGIAVQNSGRFFVIAPEFIEIKLYVNLKVENFNQVFQAKKEVLERLQEFFAFDWKKEEEILEKIGYFPDIIQLQNVIRSVSEIRAIDSMQMKIYKINADGKKEVDMDEIKKHRYILVINGEHELSIDVL